MINLINYSTKTNSLKTNNTNYSSKASLSIQKNDSFELSRNKSISFKGILNQPEIVREAAKYLELSSSKAEEVIRDAVLE